MREQAGTGQVKCDAARPEIVPGRWLRPPPSPVALPPPRGSRWGEAQGASQRLRAVKRYWAACAAPDTGGPGPGLVFQLRGVRVSRRSLSSPLSFVIHPWRGEGPAHRARWRRPERQPKDTCRLVKLFSSL